VALSPVSDVGVYLRTYLSPFLKWLEHPDVTDILVNTPGEAWVEAIGRPMVRLEAPEITGTVLQRLAQQIAAYSNQGVNREQPLISAMLPGGARVQIIAPPATRAGHMALAIRKHVVADMTLDSYEANGAFANLKRLGFQQGAELNAQLEQLLNAGAHSAFLKAAVKGGKTILISGGTGTGKTTFLNALLKEIPANDRVIVIEDTPEIRLDRPNAVGLVAVKGELGEARISVEDLLQASLRMRPDRLLVGEIRGAEAISFLRAINTGHPGSITTVHADSPRGALDQIAFMAVQAGVNLSRADVIAYTRDTVDVIVQLARTEGKRVISGIVFNGAAPQAT
jgi:type IV secretion system protein VirB11